MSGVRHTLPGCDPGYYAVALKDGKFEVRAPDGSFLGKCATKTGAAAKADVHARRARIRVRPCLSCGCNFESEGPHNRMCKTCRTASEGLI